MVIGEVYGLSWLVIVAGMLILKIVSMGRKKFSVDFQLMFRLLKLILFIGIVGIILFLLLHLTVGDIFESFLAFIPTGWALLQPCRTGANAVLHNLVLVIVISFLPCLFCSAALEFSSPLL